MWLTSSSIGRKFVMALTGACLVLFLTFHVVMNAVCIVWPTAYNQVCMFLGANWYALIASAGLALLFILHIIYAIWLTLQNRTARGNHPYAVTSLPPHVEWSSKNMLVLGIVILAFLVVHLINFWAKMQLQELIGGTATVDGAAAPAEFGTLFIQATFACWYWVLIYIIGFIALWFHMNHGFWSMFQSVGWNGRTWLPRLKCISMWWTSIVVALFIAEAVVFCVQANKNHYLEDKDLQNQYGEYWMEKVTNAYNELQESQHSALPGEDSAAAEAKMKETFANTTVVFESAAKAMSVMCKDYPMTQQINEMAGQMRMQLDMMNGSADNAAQPAPEQPAPEDIVVEAEEESAEIVEPENANATPGDNNN